MFELFALQPAQKFLGRTFRDRARGREPCRNSFRPEPGGERACSIADVTKMIAQRLPVGAVGEVRAVRIPHRAGHSKSACVRGTRLPSGAAGARCRFPQARRQGKLSMDLLQRQGSGHRSGAPAGCDPGTPAHGRLMSWFPESQGSGRGETAPTGNVPKGRRRSETTTANLSASAASAPAWTVSAGTMPPLTVGEGRSRVAVAAATTVVL